MAKYSVCSSEDTIKVVDEKWDSLDIGTFILSPSLKKRQMVFGTGAHIDKGKE